MVRRHELLARISAPPQDWPLAVCDGNSVDPDEGVKNTMVIVDALPESDAIPDELPEEGLPAASVFHFSPTHRWSICPRTCGAARCCC